MLISMKNLKTWVTIISVIGKDIRHMNVRQEPCMHQDLKVTATIVRSMDIEHLNVDPSLHGHQTSQQREEAMKIPITGITIQDVAIIIVKSMDTSLRIA